MRDEDFPNPGIGYVLEQLSKVLAWPIQVVKTLKSLVLFK